MCKTQDSKRHGEERERRRNRERERHKEREGEKKREREREREREGERGRMRDKSSAVRVCFFPGDACLANNVPELISTAGPGNLAV